MNIYEPTKIEPSIVDKTIINPAPDKEPEQTVEVTEPEVAPSTAQPEETPVVEPITPEIQPEQKPEAIEVGADDIKPKKRRGVS